VPRALVVLLSKSGQVYPGAYGLPEPWETRRSMPLTYSMSLQVVATGAPMVISDARQVQGLSGRPPVLELAVVGYAAMPLTDVHGRTIGVLSVSDDRPRNWTRAELDCLHQLAAEASRRLQSQALELAEREAVAAGVRADDAARKAAAAASAALVAAEAAADRARVVARLSAELLPAETLLDVLRGVDRYLRSPLGGVVVLLGLADTGCPDLGVWSLTAGTAPSPRSGRHVLQLDDPHPLAVAARERRLVPVATRAEGAAEFPELARGPGCSAETSLAAPLVLGQHTSIGGLLIGWRHARPLDPPLQEVVSDLARHVGHALDRVLLRDQLLALGTATPPVSAAAAS
jgi:GAF domain-containing protein